MLQQWIDLARYTGLQTRKTEASLDASDSVEVSPIKCNGSDETNANDINNKWAPILSIYYCICM